MSNSKSNQQHLFDLNPYDELPPPSMNRWYYVTNPQNTKMLVTDDDGNFTWAKADTQTNVPYLWNSAQTARRDIKRRRFKGIVRRYPFTTMWWT